MTKLTDTEVTLIEFDYKKPTDAASTKRQLLVISHPSDSYFGLEVIDGDLTPAQPYLAYLKERKVLDDYLKAKHGIDKAGIEETGIVFKRFKVDRIVSVITESKLST